MIATPMDAKTASKLAANFVSRSRIRHRARRPPLRGRRRRRGPVLGDPTTVRVGRDAEETDDAAFDLNDEQDVLETPLSY
jgi:hypothetical protein